VWVVLLIMVVVWIGNERVDVVIVIVVIVGFLYWHQLIAPPHHSGLHLHYSHSYYWH